MPCWRELDQQGQSVGLIIKELFFGFGDELVDKPGQTLHNWLILARARTDGVSLGFEYGGQLDNRDMGIFCLNGSHLLLLVASCRDATKSARRLVSGWGYLFWYRSEERRVG